MQSSNPAAPNYVSPLLNATSAFNTSGPMSVDPGYPATPLVSTPDVASSVNPLGVPASYYDAATQRNNALAATTAKNNAEDRAQATTTRNIGALATGLQSGESVSVGTDTGSNVAGVLGAGASGALAGAMTGNPYLALAGGAIGLVTAGVNAYFGQKAARKAKAAQDLLNQQIQARQDQQLAQQRADQINQFNASMAERQGEFNATLNSTNEDKRYTRDVAAKQAQWVAMQNAGQKVMQSISDNQALKDIFIKQARQ